MGCINILVEQREGRTPARMVALRLRTLSVSLVFAALVFVVVPAAYAGNEGGSADPALVDCEQCHSEVALPDVGPHGFYNDPAATRCGTLSRSAQKRGRRDPPSARHHQGLVQHLPRRYGRPGSVRWLPRTRPHSQGWSRRRRHQHHTRR